MGNEEEKHEPKDIIVSIKDANEDSTSSSSSEEEENDLETNGNVDNESEVNDDEPKQNAILEQKSVNSVTPNKHHNLRPKPMLKRTLSDEMEESEEEEEIDDDEPEELKDESETEEIKDESENEEIKDE